MQLFISFLICIMNHENDYVGGSIKRFCVRQKIYGACRTVMTSIYTWSKIWGPLMSYTIPTCHVNPFLRSYMDSNFSNISWQINHMWNARLYFLQIINPTTKSSTMELSVLVFVNKVGSWVSQLLTRPSYHVLMKTELNIWEMRSNHFILINCIHFELCNK